MAYSKWNPSNVKWDTVFADESMPPLDLSDKLEGKQWRIYIIECYPQPGKLGPCWYVGICHRSEIKQRLAKHWSGTAAHYTRMNKPKEIQMIWPASNKATEAYAYYALLDTLPPNSARRVGGWTQTSHNPSRLGCAVTEQGRRCMREHCFNCGECRFNGSHKTKENGKVMYKCPKPLRGVDYHCECGKAILVTTRGHAEPIAVAPPSPPANGGGGGGGGGSDGGGGGTARKRAAPILPAEPMAKRAKKATASTHAGLRVSICGELYTSVSWYVNNRNPPKGLCAELRSKCVDDAIELEGGHVRALTGTVYAVAPPSQPKPLCRMACGKVRERLGAEDFVPTEVFSLKVKRAGGTLRKQSSQVLWSVAALDRVISRVTMWAMC
jgi:predicted GIY-YIG superfamily endonuclease